jgi:hypothetical protein
MDETRFAPPVQALADATGRRAALRSLGAASLALLAALGLDAAAARKRKKKKRKKRGQGPPLGLAYQCAGAVEAAFSTGGSVLIAQRFAATRSGRLRQIRAPITKDPGTGDFVIQLVAVSGAPNGTPSDYPLDVLETVTIPDASVPDGESTLVGTFAGPRLVQGTEYAAVVSRRGAAFTPHARGGCDGVMFAGAPYAPSPLGLDLIVSVLVDEDGEPQRG